MKEFFGFGGYTREPEGYFSSQHLTLVTCFMILMVTLAVLLARWANRRDEAAKRRVLIGAAIMIDAFEIFKIVIMCIRAQDASIALYELPLFLCSIQLVTIPLAAFAKGRVREASLDFVCIFGILGAVLGTYFAGQNYATYPVFSFDNVISAITHSISGFASLFIALAHMTKMRNRNIPITVGILTGFCVTAYIVNRVIDYNYMFLMRGDGTPYDIFFGLVGGHPVLYPLTVYFLFILYIAFYYGVHHLLLTRKAKKLKTDEKLPLTVS